MKKIQLLIVFCMFIVGLMAQMPSNKINNITATKAKIDKLANDLEPKVIEWRRHFHQYPELSNREFKTAEKVATHLKGLGMEVRTGIAHTGVVGILKGGKPGPVIALRADMDALPVLERADLPFASKEKSKYNGQDVGVMHACGHDFSTCGRRRT